VHVHPAPMRVLIGNDVRENVGHWSQPNTMMINVNNKNICVFNVFMISNSMGRS